MSHQLNKIYQHNSSQLQVNCEVCGFGRIVTYCILLAAEMVPMAKYCCSVDSALLFEPINRSEIDPFYNQKYF